MKTATMAIALLTASPALARSSTYYDGMQASQESHVFFQQGGEADVGTITNHGRPEYWKGYGTTTTLGTDYRRFIQVVIDYTMLDGASSTHEQRAWGQKLDIGLRLAFSSPIGNLELGAGADASKLSTAYKDQEGTVVGTGTYESIGINHYVYYGISLCAQVKHEDVNYRNDSGTSFLDGAEGTQYRPSLGLRIRF